jgi:hypothetical protein
MAAKPFIDTLRALRDGQTEDDLANELNALVEAVATTGKKGTLTLTITVQKISKNSEQLVLVDDVKTKLPKADRGASIFWPTPENNLVRHDPRQGKLELKRVPVVEEPPRVAGDGNA